MKSYNGFTPAQRRRAGAWLRTEWKEGRLEAPTRCCACGNGGLVHAHAEDYSEPYGPHVGKYPLCYVCHLVLHCRHRDMDRWRWYAGEVAKGRRPIQAETQNFPLVTRIMSGSCDPFDNDLPVIAGPHKRLDLIILDRY